MLMYLPNLVFKAYWNFIVNKLLCDKQCFWNNSLNTNKKVPTIQKFTTGVALCSQKVAKMCKADCLIVPLFISIPNLVPYNPDCDWY